MSMTTYYWLTSFEDFPWFLSKIATDTLRNGIIEYIFSDSLIERRIYMIAFISRFQNQCPCWHFCSQYGLFLPTARNITALSGWIIQSFQLYSSKYVYSILLCMSGTMVPLILPPGKARSWRTIVWIQITHRNVTSISYYYHIWFDSFVHVFIRTRMELWIILLLSVNKKISQFFFHLLIL